MVAAAVSVALRLRRALSARSHVLLPVVDPVTAAPRHHASGHHQRRIGRRSGTASGVVATWLVRKLSTRPLRRPTPRGVAVARRPRTVALGVFLYLGLRLATRDPPADGRDTAPALRLSRHPPACRARGGGRSSVCSGCCAAAPRIGCLLGRWIPAQAAAVIAGPWSSCSRSECSTASSSTGSSPSRTGRSATVNGETEPGRAATGRPAALRRPGLAGDLGVARATRAAVFVAGGPTRTSCSSSAGPTTPADPRLRRPGVGADLPRAGSARGAGAATHRRVLPKGALRGDHHRHRLGRQQAVDPLEYMYNGDTAIVGMQYSYLPSWLSFLVDKERAQEAGRDLFNQVYGVWSRCPAAAPETARLRREPRLVRRRVGVQRRGRHPQPDRRHAAGRTAEPQRTVARDRGRPRDAGSTEVLPSYEQGDDGAVRRRRRTDLTRPPTAWATPRAWSTCSTPPTRSSGGRPG